jgi:hypothetical protein
MNKRAISLTLSPDNLLWLRAQTRVSGRRSISDFLDGLVSDARLSAKHEGGAARSVVGSVRIDRSDPGLSKADAAVKLLFTASLSRRSGAQSNPAAARSVHGPSWRRRRSG